MTRYKKLFKVLLKECMFERIDYEICYQIIMRYAYNAKLVDENFKLTQKGRKFINKR